MENRVYGEKVNIDYNQTLEFFENRGKNKKLGTKYNYVLFQDDSPDIAIKRDSQEKSRICKFLSWDKKDIVLDIGCGIGRWGETILEKGLKYVGIDYSTKLLKIAEENLTQFGKTKILLHGSFQRFREVLSENGINNVFQKIFINGVMMYINDMDLKNGLDNVLSTCDEYCEIYFKESMATNERLTLKDFYSDSLTQKYTVIYRSIAEYRELIERYFVENKFKIKEEGVLFEETLQNRKETLDYFFILKR